MTSLYYNNECTVYTLDSNVKSSGHRISLLIILLNNWWLLFYNNSQKLTGVTSNDLLRKAADNLLLNFLNISV